MQPKSVSWLHLSDLHRGQRADRRWVNRKRVLLDDLEEFCSRRGKPDLILFTGDLTNGGTREEYDLMDETLGEIRASIGAPVPIFPVPGNHDLERPPAHSIPHGLVQYFDSPAGRSTRADIMAEQKGCTHDTIAQYFKNYEEWLERSVLPEWEEIEWSFTKGAMSGDIRLRADINGLTIGLVGVNSAFLDLHDGVSVGQIAVETSQLGEDIDAWCRDCHVSLLLMHHPPEWVHPKLNFWTEISPNGRFAAVLHGHIHVPEARETRNPRVRRQCTAPSLAGVEDYLVPRDEDQIIGYAYGRLEQSNDEQNALLSYWLRRATTSPSGVWVQPYGGCDPFEMKDVSLRKPEYRRHICLVHYPPRLDKALGELFAEAQRLLQVGDRNVARSKFLRIAEQAEPASDASTPNLQRRAELARLAAAICLVELGNLDEAKEELECIAPERLDDTGLADLASLLAQLGAPARAREIANGRSGMPFDVVRQLATIAEGNIPDSPLSGYVRVCAANLCIEKGELRQAVSWALQSVQESYERRGVVANAVSIILTCAERLLFSPLREAAPLSSEHIKRSVQLFEEELQGSMSSLGSLIGECELQRWKLRYANLCQDLELLEEARRNLRNLGADDRKLGGTVLVLEPVDASEDALLAVVSLIERGEASMADIVLAARVSVLLGRSEVAVQYSEKAFSLWPGTGQRLLLAHAKHLAGQNEFVETLVTDISVRDRPSAIRLHAASVCATPGREHEALALWDEYVSRVPDDMSGRVRLAWLRYATGAFSHSREDVLKILRTLQNGSPVTADLLSQVSALIVATTRDLESTSRELREVAQMAAKLSQSVPAVEQLYFQIWHRLTDRNGLPTPNYHHLLSEGILKAVEVEDAAGQLAQLREWNSALRQGYADGLVPFEGLIDGTGMAAAEIVTRTLHAGGRFTGPSPSLYPVPDLRGKRVLVGHLELLLILDFDVLNELVSALGEDGELVVFRDVWQRIQTEPLVLCQHFGLSELGHLRKMVRTLESARAFTGLPEEKVDEWSHLGPVCRVVSGEDAKSSVELTISSLVGVLVKKGVLPTSAHKSMNAPIDNHIRATTDVFTGVILDFASVLRLHGAGLLRTLLESSRIKTYIGKESENLLRTRIDGLSLVGEAARKAAELVESVGQLQRTGRIRTVRRPQVDVPCPSEGFDERCVSWTSDALSWLNTIDCDDESSFFLSADLLTSGLLAGATPLELVQTLRWNEDLSRYTRLTSKRHAVRSRVITIGSVLRQLVQDTPPTINKIVKMGFGDAVEAADIVALAREWDGLGAERPKELLDEFEGPTRKGGLHQAAHYPLSCAHLYASSIWSIWEDEKNSLADRVTSELLGRLEAVPYHIGRCPLEVGLRIILQYTSLRVVDAVIEGPGSKFTFSEDSLVGRIWASIAKWIDRGKASRLTAFRSAFRVTLADSSRGLTGDELERRVGPLVIAMNLVDAEGGNPFVPGSSLEALAISSGGWGYRPLSRMGISITGDGRNLDFSAEDLLMAAAKAIEDPDVRPTNTGVSLIVPICLDGEHLEIQVPPEAILLRFQADRRGNLAAVMGRAYRADDGRGASFLQNISNAPDCEESLRAYAEYAVNAPWRRVRSCVYEICTWGRGDIMYPCNIIELRELLSEPLSMEKADIVDIIRGRSSSIWNGEQRLCLQSLRLPGGLGLSSILCGPSEFIGRLSQLFGTVDGVLEGLSSPDELWLSEILEGLHALALIAHAEPDGRRETFKEPVARLLHKLAAGGGAGSRGRVEHALMVACANVVYRMSRGVHELPARESVWLCWRFFQWFVDQVDRSGCGLADLLKVAKDGGKPERRGLPEVLDPVRFGPLGFDHRLASVLQLMSTLTSASLVPLLNGDAVAVLQRLCCQRLSNEESELVALPPTASALGWGSSPRTIPGLARKVLDVMEDNISQ